MTYSVGSLSALAGVSVRTLHHYDQIGLLTPSQRSAAGYRQYTTDDVARLHRILVYRELGFDLSRIAQILDDPAADALEHLRQQHALLTERRSRLQSIIEAVEAMMSAKKSGYNMTPEEMREVFGAFDPTEHEPEVKQRWGDTDAYRQSQSRARSYGRTEWLKIREETEQIESGLAALMAQGLPAQSQEAMDLAEQHRQHISRWFYECPYAMHRGLAGMYIADPRFALHYDERAPGLSEYVHDAVIANADRADVRP